MEIAYRIYPLPDGTVYTEEDIKTMNDVVVLFDYCQIMEATISKYGWEFLIQKFGMDGLYQADKISGWFDSDSMEEFISDIEYEKSYAYSDESDHIEELRHSIQQADNGQIVSKSLDELKAMEN